jgi:hypothetical protein
MKRRSFLKNSALVAGTASLSLPVLGNRIAADTEKSIFEWRIYHISRVANAKNLLEQYFKEALIPFLGKRSIRFAAFNDYSLEEPVRLFVLLAYPNASVYFNVQSDLQTDADYLNAAKSYLSIPASGAVFSRYETFLLEAFDKFPSLSIPSEKKNIFELRLYESANEDAGKRKIEMFNKEEIPVFLKVGLMPVFFGRILAGQYMPALLYMVGFKDMADRDAAWGRFSQNEDWKNMQNKPEYADTVSNIQKIFLTSTSYSQV